MKITIQTIPHKQQRYNTVGDWVIWPENNIEIYVSDMNDWKNEALVGVHELMEILLCYARGITQAEVDKFDVEFEKNRRSDDLSEPGDSPQAPYRKEHFFATNIERLVAAELGVDWNEYDKTVANL